MHLEVLVRQNNHPSPIPIRRVVLPEHRMPGTPPSQVDSRVGIGRSTINRLQLTAGLPVVTGLVVFRTLIGYEDFDNGLWGLKQVMSPCQ